MDFTAVGPGEPWDPSDDDCDPNTDQLAFAAYEDAWAERINTGRVSTELLITALKTRKVPAREYATGTRLQSTLFGSWDRGRRPGRMHGVILRYRLGRTADGFRDLTSIFRHSTPEHMRLPAELISARKWRPAYDETTLVFTPTGTFAARIGAWYDAIDDDARERAVPVWFDTAARPERTPVMVGRELAGHTDLPPWAHALLTGATKRGRRVVATGDLRVKRRKAGTWRADVISAELPKRKD